MAKIASDQAKPNGMIWVPPGQEAGFLGPLPVSKIPGVGKKTEERLATYGVHFVGDLARIEEKFLEELMGKWGLALAGKAHGLDAGGYFNHDVAEESDPKSISHEHTFDKDSADAELLESTLAKLSQMVGRRLREHDMHARTVSDQAAVLGLHNADAGSHAGCSRRKSTSS